ncbi:low molecular weight protein arginine phosphatase [Luteolibacter pohnpeiensis]|uniref:protein-tyrosine-phosphatase n=1 Tax=Luteolibacter pohnpeiensis TaxID=454153 RepID=A0A934S872_9BACT|nr:low molecular weight protein arginine phosphatase [Luteolibacter pohnpeiensis]MBK1881154.1 low molecular weight protein arginine phosphatase [Luteolibacter pohnpeiensis]
MSSKKRVLFVCTGNTCRSPMAEGLFTKLVADRKDFSVASAGVSAYPGDTANPETELILKKRGASLKNFTSQPVTSELLDEATHVFAMTSSHLATLEARFPEQSEKYHLACDFVELPGRGIGADVPDPIGMGRRAYEETAAILDAALPMILSYIDQTWKDD